MIQNAINVSSTLLDVSPDPAREHQVRVAVLRVVSHDGAEWPETDAPQKL